MRLVDAQITHRWWDELLNDEERMVKWLQKLQVTELDGYQGNLDANEEWNITNRSLVKNVFERTADDEKRHSDMLVLLLRDRGVETLPFEPSSLYWDEMYKHIDSLESCCAVFYFGEKLAAERFDVIFNHEKTPHDVLNFIAAALPDETYHAESYKRLAGMKALEDMLEHHNRVMKLLLGNRSKVTDSK